MARSVSNKLLTCIYLQNATRKVMDICHLGVMEPPRRDANSVDSPGKQLLSVSCRSFFCTAYHKSMGT